MSATSRRMRAVLLAFALTLLAVFGASLPAAAHDGLVGSTPAEGDTLVEAPTAVSLEFSGEVQHEGLAAAVTADSDGSDWLGGEPSADGYIITVPVAADIPNGAYTVTVRFVSSDSHPTESTLHFTVDVPEATPTASASPAASVTPAASATPSSSAPQAATATPAASPTAAAQSDGGSDALWWVLGVAAAVVVIAVVVALILRRRPRH